MSGMLLSQEGMHALAWFHISADSYDEKGRRYETNDGLMLTCIKSHEDGTHWMRRWPGHVAAPDLRHLVMVAERHWAEEHQNQNATDADE